MNIWNELKLIVLIGMNPFMLGVIAYVLQKSKRKITWSIVFLKGYMLYFALVFLCSMLPNLKNSSYVRYMEYLSISMKTITCIILSLGSVIFFRKIKSISGLTLNTIDYVKKNKGVVIIAIIESVISILFIVPNPSDDTIAQINMMKTTDMIYCFNPITGAAVEKGGIITKGIDTFYAYLSEIHGGYIGEIIEYRIPVFFFIIVFGVYRYISMVLFSEDMLRRLFIGMIELFFGIQIFIRGFLGIAIIRNVWNGTTIMVSVVLPLVFVILMQGYYSLEKELLIYVFLLSFVAAFVYQNGWIYVLLMMGIFVVTYLLLIKMGLKHVADNK